MCFSPEADLVSGIVVGAIGIDALRHVGRPGERPLAAIPVLLGGHQLVEALVWWGLRGDVSRDVWRPSLVVYLAVAFVVLPVLVPWAVGGLEPVSNRGRMLGFTVVGTGVALVLLHALVQGPIDAVIDGHHVDYRVDLWGGGVIVGLYVVATCGALLTSAHAHVRWFGVVNLVVVVALAWLDQRALVSLWCAWAAVTSVAIAVHLRHVGEASGPSAIIVAP